MGLSSTELDKVIGSLVAAKLIVLTNNGEERVDIIDCIILIILIILLILIIFQWSYYLVVVLCIDLDPQYDMMMGWLQFLTID